VVAAIAHAAINWIAPSDAEAAEATELLVKLGSFPELRVAGLWVRAKSKHLKINNKISGIRQAGSSKSLGVRVLYRKVSSTR
jgi:hypothetical protein